MTSADSDYQACGTWQLLLVVNFMSSKYSKVYYSSQVTDQVDNMMENLVTTAEQVENAEPISAHPDKLKDQLADNAALIEDLDKRLAALDAVRATADELAAQSGMDDEATRGKYLINRSTQNISITKGERKKQSFGKTNSMF